jgi:hypothetical protein
MVNVGEGYRVEEGILTAIVPGCLSAVSIRLGIFEISGRLFVEVAQGCQIIVPAIMHYIL